LVKTEPEAYSWGDLVKEQYPDSITEDQRCIAVDLIAVSKFDIPVDFAAIRAHPDLQELILVRQGRISIIPIPIEFWKLRCCISQK
jgi:predicted RNA-binding protein with PUA-like domain